MGLATCSNTKCEKRATCQRHINTFKKAEPYSVSMNYQRVCTDKTDYPFLVVSKEERLIESTNGDIVLIKKNF